MQRDEAISILMRHQAQLAALGVLHLAVFGSTARNEADEASDVDIEVSLSDGPRGFAHLRRLDELRRVLRGILGRPVDVITDTAGSRRVRERVARERVHAF
jgi:predicted nucleotidyltransferase